MGNDLKMEENFISMRSYGVPARPAGNPPVVSSPLPATERTNKVEYLPLFTQKMKSENLAAPVIEAFRYYYAKIRDGSQGLIGEDAIDPLDPEALVQADQLGLFAEAGKKALPWSVRIVLNGGLGTSMGLEGAKSLIPVKDRRSFLEITLNQALRQKVALCFMNSFSTHNATRGFIAAHRFSPSGRAILSRTNFPKS